MAAHTSVSGSLRNVAFFDLDGTLVVGNTQYLLVKYFRSRRMVSPLFVMGSALWFVGYKAGLFKVTEEARARAASMLRGLTVPRVEAIMAGFTAEVLAPRAHQGALAALERHKEAHDRIVVLSAALEPVVRSLCGLLDVTDFVGAPCETIGSVYTGRLSGPTPYAELKAEVAKRYMEAWGVNSADCWAYADHGTDVTLLRSVGHPVAVNPRPELAAVARQEGWPILT